MVYLIFLISFSCYLILSDAWSLSTRAFSSHYNTHCHRRQQSTILHIGPQQLGEFEVLSFDANEISERRVALLDYSGSPSHIPFETAWDWQKDVLNEHVMRMTTDDGNSQFLTSETGTTGTDTVIMLQHQPVYTLGTGSDEKFVLGINENVPVVRMDRGGEVTYHGPGQLTVYPVLDLRSYRQDIHWYMRALEEAILLALSKCGLDRAERQEDVTGVWIDNFKVAACGVKVKRWVTMHGLAVNVDFQSLDNFEGIVPCGLDGRKVGCINQFIDNPITVIEFAKLMKESLEEVFEISLVYTDRDFPSSMMTSSDD